MATKTEELIEALVREGRRGKYYYAAKAGRLHIATSATGGIALIVAAATGGHPTLWNPLGSGRLLSIKKLVLAYVSGNNAPGSLAWNQVLDAGSDIGPTGAAILTATKVPVLNAVTGKKVDSKAIWSPTINTFTAAPAFHRPIGISLFTGIATTAVAPFLLEEEYDDDLMIEPGNAECLVAQQTTTTALFRVGILYEDIDE